MYASCRKAHVPVISADGEPAASSRTWSSKWAVSGRNSRSVNPLLQPGLSRSADPQIIIGSSSVGERPSVAVLDGCRGKSRASASSGASILELPAAPLPERGVEGSQILRPDLHPAAI